jgi:sialic acid synthase SpsE
LFQITKLATNFGILVSTVKVAHKFEKMHLAIFWSVFSHTRLANMLSCLAIRIFKATSLCIPWWYLIAITIAQQAEPMPFNHGTMVRFQKNLYIVTYFLASSV